MESGTGLFFLQSPLFIDQTPKNVKLFRHRYCTCTLFGLFKPKTGTPDLLQAKRQQLCSAYHQNPTFKMRFASILDTAPRRHGANVRRLLVSRSSLIKALRSFLPISRRFFFVALQSGHKMKAAGS